ncbi:MAG: hypothetical protein NTX45_26880 [Proteobacteria bacterium]|nr:hypothetical protein [Pseudomonadota bacterium]
MNKQGRDLEARIGFIIDCWRMFRFNFQNPHSWVKYRQLVGLQKRTGAEVLFETGTYLGVTTRRCVRHFKRIETIELDSNLAKAAKKFLLPFPHVKVIEGDALYELPKCIARMSTAEKAIVFLDGHFSGGDTACSSLPEPACEEIELFRGKTDQIAGVIIDDFRMFGVQQNAPTKSELFKKIEEVFGPSFQIQVLWDQVVITRSC